MTRVRLVDLSDAEIGALLTAARGHLRSTPRGWCAASDPTTRIDTKTFHALVRHGLLYQRAANSGAPRYTALLTPRGHALADVAITVSRQIATAIVGLETRSFLPLIDDGAPAADAQPDAAAQANALPAAAAPPELPRRITPRIPAYLFSRD